MPYVQETRIFWSAERSSRRAGAQLWEGVRVQSTHPAEYPECRPIASWLQEGGGLHEFQRLNSGDCCWLSSAWNPCRSNCGSGCGLADWSIFFRIQHHYKYPVAFSGHIFVGERGILADSPAHQTCRARIHASCVTGYSYELVGLHYSGWTARNLPIRLSPRSRLDLPIRQMFK